MDQIKWLDGDTITLIMNGVDAYTGEPITKTPRSHPYSYQPFEIYSNTEVETTGNAYNDRMIRWDWEHFEVCCQEVWGNHGQLFYSYIRKPKEIEKFLQLYFRKPTLVLTRIVEGCNPSNGYSYWQFSWGEK